MKTQNNNTEEAQQIINESDGLSNDEKTVLYLSKLARGDLQ